MNKDPKRMKMLALGVGGLLLFVLLSVGSYFIFSSFNNEELSVDDTINSIDKDIESLDENDELSPLTADQLGYDYDTENVEETVTRTEESIDELDESLDLLDLSEEDFGF